MVNNAGFMAHDAWEPLGRSGWEDWDYCMDVNMMGTVRVTRALLPVMLRGGDRTVVNMVSIGALYAEGGGEAYSLAKFTLSRLAEFLCHGYTDEVSSPTHSDDIQGDSCLSDGLARRHIVLGSPQRD